MVPEIVKQISTQFNSLKTEGNESIVKSEGPMCKAQDSNYMSHTTYKTRLAHDI